MDLLYFHQLFDDFVIADTERDQRHRGPPHGETTKRPLFVSVPHTSRLVIGLPVVPFLTVFTPHLVLTGAGHDLSLTTTLEEPHLSVSTTRPSSGCPNNQ